MRILIAVLMTLLLATSASAFTVCFEWTENPPGATIGYKLYEDQGLVEDIPYGTTEACVTWADEEVGCKDYTLTAYDNHYETDPTGPISVCMVNVPEGYKRMVLIN